MRIISLASSFTILEQQSYDVLRMPLLILHGMISSCIPHHFPSSERATETQLLIYNDGLLQPPSAGMVNLCRDEITHAFKHKIDQVRRPVLCISRCYANICMCCSFGVVLGNASE